jgi:hypothetical protein
MLLSIRISPLFFPCCTLLALPLGECCSFDVIFFLFWLDNDKKWIHLLLSWLKKKMSSLPLASSSVFWGFPMVELSRHFFDEMLDQKIAWYGKLTGYITSAIYFVRRP